MNDCEFCGFPLEVSVKRGRPSVYHPDCAKIHHSLTWAISQLECIAFSAVAAGRLRRRVFIMVNGAGRVSLDRDKAGRFVARGNL